ncbi:MAG TPA: pyrroloquinoline quinone-dependent dehydrogenase [Terriglobia bacterium]|jgi:quinoprotein glucose dehydrogenase
MSRSLRYAIAAGLLISALLLILPLAAQKGALPGQWQSYSADHGSTGYSPIDLINRDNVKNLQAAWSWKFDNFGNTNSEVTPIMVNGILYFPLSPRRTIVAADAGTGETLWTWRPPEDQRETRAARTYARGVAYWKDGSDERIVTITPGFRLVALDLKTGHPVPGFGQNGAVDLFESLDLDFQGDLIGRIGNSSPPVISNGVIMVGPALTPNTPSFHNVKGDVMGFDARTGKKLWVFHTIPRKGEFGYDTWLNNSADYTGNTGVWGPFSTDEELGYAYLNIEDATNDFYGGHRPGANLFSNSLVCIDIKTGKRIWHQQLVHHDIWDYDMPPAPILIDITVDGRPIKAVVQTGKQALTYVFDRTNGKPVWPMPETPVKQTDIPGEWTSPTQPLPSKPPAFGQVGLHDSDLIDFTPELHQQAVAALKASNLRYGDVFMPGSLANAPDGTRGTVMLFGGSNWWGGRADPETGFVYIAGATSPYVIALHKNTPAANAPPPDPKLPPFDYAGGGGAPFPTLQGLSIIKPPYGRITAYDMNKGTIAWQIANGDTPANVKNHPLLQGLNIPKTGTARLVGVLLTKTLLFAGDGTSPVLHAYDKKTGEDIAQIPMPGMQTGVPMTYIHQGRQFVLIPVGANAQTGTAAQLVAFALPAPGGRGGRGQRGQRGQ